MVLYQSWLETGIINIGNEAEYPLSPGNNIQLVHTGTYI